MRHSILLLPLLLQHARAASAAFAAVTVAPNGTSYYATADAPYVLRVNGAVAVPMYANVRGVALAAEGLFVSLSTNVVRRPTLA